MGDVKTLARAAADVLDDIERLGINEALGLEEIPANRKIDPTKCRCGAGCESLLECTFWYYVRKTNRMERMAQRQVSIGKYRVDCLFDCDGKRVVVELDGKEFHDAKRDRIRDGDLLHHVDAIIRIPFAAMNYYPNATFSVLASWFPRFALRGVDQFCMPVSELRREMDGSVNSSGHFRTEAEWLEWAEPRFELWAVVGGIGWAATPKAWLHCWRVSPITLATKENRGDSLTIDCALRHVRDGVAEQIERDSSFDVFNRREFVA